MKPETLIQTWIVEDHDTFRRSLQRLCAPERGLAAAPAFANAETMLAALKSASAEQKPDVLLLDVGLPGRSGLEIISDVHHLAPDCRIVILTVFEDEAKISQARVSDVSRAHCRALGQSRPTDSGNSRVRMRGAARRTRMREYMGAL